jgi:2-amino-4-hydroxy-6-hydroxymethyldihydropteridine diphosphokinase
VVARSSWYRSTPVPPSDQPLFVNGVVQVVCALTPQALLAALLRIERSFGRERGAANAARTLDLDIIGFGARVIESEALTLPHPRMADRLFVLLPLAETLPDWRHPTLGLSARALLARLPAADGGDRVERL